MSLEEKLQKYYELCHAMQAGVAMKMQKDDHDTTPKHLRVGVNSALVESGALVGLLIKKGVITEEEWWDALIEAMEREVEMYTAKIKELYGDGKDINITLV